MYLVMLYSDIWILMIVDSVDMHRLRVSDEGKRWGCWN